MLSLVSVCPTLLNIYTKRFQVIVFDIKTFDHTNDSLFKRVTKDTKLNTPEQQLCHTVHITQACQNILTIQVISKVNVAILNIEDNA
jgi:hypothetical protein